MRAGQGGGQEIQRRQRRVEAGKTGENRGSENREDRGAWKGGRTWKTGRRTTEEAGEESQEAGKDEKKAVRTTNTGKTEEAE